ncbi:hypothetical protein AB0G77_04155 [Streptomyces hygroscopicus]|uniref:hypothetical protein n=1 Tax=Streptomyces hygroscopicus TaxID=1912 RepID=UPI0033E8CC6A
MEHTRAFFFHRRQHGSQGSAPSVITVRTADRPQERRGVAGSSPPPFRLIRSLDLVPAPGLAGETILPAAPDGPERTAVLSTPILVTMCVASLAAVMCCAFVCNTFGKIAAAALRGSRSADRPQIIQALGTAFRQFLRPWWRRG